MSNPVEGHGWFSVGRLDAGSAAESLQGSVRRFYDMGHSYFLVFTPFALVYRDVIKGTVRFGHGFSTQDRSRKGSRAQLEAL